MMHTVNIFIKFLEPKRVWNTKYYITNRKRIARGLIKNGDFIVVLGAKPVLHRCEEKRAGQSQRERWGFTKRKKKILQTSCFFRRFVIQYSYIMCSIRGNPCCIHNEEANDGTD